MARPWSNLPLTKLIHENFSLIMTFAFSRPTLIKWVNTHFEGEWKYLGIACFEMSEERANRAVLEFATQVRLLDNSDPLPEYFTAEFGKVVQKDGTEEKLYFRDMTNKILHSSAIVWDFSNEDDPIIICIPHDPERWVRADIKISRIAFYCGTLMS
jgi:hypothetical protein